MARPSSPAGSVAADTLVLARGVPTPLPLAASSIAAQLPPSGGSVEVLIARESTGAGLLITWHRRVDASGRLAPCEVLPTDVARLIVTRDAPLWLITRHAGRVLEARPVQFVAEPR